MTKESPPTGSGNLGVTLALACWVLQAPLVWLFATQPWDPGCNSGPRAAERDIANLSTSVEIYRVARKHNPTSIEALLDAGLIRKIVRDPWGHHYLLVCPSTDGPCGILSAGKDGMFGTADDIRSWGDPEPPPDPRASA